MAPQHKPDNDPMTAEAWAKINEMMEDSELVKIAETRIKDGKKPVRVTLDDL